MEKDPHTRRCRLSGPQSTVLVIEGLANDNNDVDGAFHGIIKIA